MNAKINKVINEIERAKTKLSELQTLLPELEQKRIDMEDTEIVRLVRLSANISLADFPEFIRAMNVSAAVPAPVSYPVEEQQTHEGDTVGSAQDFDNAQESSFNGGAGEASHEHGDGISGEEATGTGLSSSDEDDEGAEAIISDENSEDAEADAFGNGEGNSNAGAWDGNGDYNTGQEGDGAHEQSY